MKDMWSHSHDWDNGYAVGHKDGYQQGRADAIDEAYSTILIDIENGQKDIKGALSILEQIKEQNK